MLASWRAASEPPGDLTELTATQALEQILAGILGAGDYMTALAERAERLAGLNALLASRWQEAIAEARAIDDRRAAGQDVGALAGLPLLAADNLDSAGLPTTAGTPALADWRPEVDAAVLARALDRAGVLVAKGNLHELGLGVTSNNRSFGAVGNPYAPDMIAGGASGGVAAAVAARMAPLGLAADGSGSSRIPAALCGCIAFRPGMDRWTPTGLVPLSSTFDSPSAVARSVADIVLLDSVCAEVPATVETVGLAGLRLGVPRRLDAGLDLELATILGAALALLQSAGAELVEIEMPDLSEADEAVGPPILLHEALRELAAYLLMHDSRMSVLDIVTQVAGEAERTVLTGIAGDLAVPASAYREALLTARPRLQGLFAEAFASKRLDAILGATTPLPARPIGQEAEVEINGEKLPTFAAYSRNVDPPSHAGLPALTLPAGLTARGLPVGLQLVGRAGADGRLLSIAAAAEAALPPLPPPRL
ncbi:MAG TPA: amidase family protein [Geminicoccaceae bacterium]|nr:amidase family protein [Geminicoccus sp.]HMU48227.1 amidase family protein [Geminicoccaceae bacterium]